MKKRLKKPDTGSRKGYSRFLNRAVKLLVLTALLFSLCISASAAGLEDSLTSLQTVMFSVTRIVGGLVTLFGFIMLGVSLPTHDPSQRSMGFLSVAGGLVIVFAKEILEIIGAI